jgi:hypothetical protein
MTVVRCTICDQEFDTFDSLYELCIEKHNQFHDPAFKGGNRDDTHYNLQQKNRTRNMTFGVPEYV